MIISRFNSGLFALLAFSCLTFITSATAQNRRGIGNVRITQIQLLDQGGTAAGFETAIDTKQDLCPSEDQSQEDKPEPFFDTLIGLEITNSSDFPVRFKKSKFVIRNYDGRRVKAKKLSMPGIREVADGQINLLPTFMLQANKELGLKIPFGRNQQPLEVKPIVSNVKFVLIGRDFSGKRIRLRAKRAIAFRNDDRCP